MELYVSALFHLLSNIAYFLDQPKLIQAGRVLSSGGAYTSKGPLVAAIAYLQTGPCLLNGEKCTTLETTLKNPTCPGCGSSTDVSLIPPHKFSVATSFKYTGGCNGVGNGCEYYLNDKGLAPRSAH